MTDFRPPWDQPLNAMLGIPICTDPEVPAGTAVLDVDPDEPRHITRVRTAGHYRDMQLTDAQTEQIRDHYRAMNERAGHLLDEWPRIATRLGLDTH